MLPMDPRLKVQLNDLVSGGVRRLPEMQRHLQHFVEHTLFCGRPMPARTDSRYWPSSKTVLNAMYQAALANQFVYTSNCAYDKLLSILCRWICQYVHWNCIDCTQCLCIQDSVACSVISDKNRHCQHFFTLPIWHTDIISTGEQRELVAKRLSLHCASVCLSGCLCMHCRQLCS